MAHGEGHGNYRPRYIFSREEMDHFQDNYIHHEIEHTKAKVSWLPLIMVWGVVFAALYFVFDNIFFPREYYFYIYGGVVILSKILIGVDTGVRMK